LVGWLVCGRCGRRVRTAHGGKAQHVRSTCMRATSAAGGPGCRRLAGAFLERFGAAQGRQGLQPASRALRLAAEQTLRAEREPCAAQWPQRLERAPSRAQRAARQDAAVEPAKRLVAREWERRWAEALRHEQPRQEAEARFRRARPLEVPGREREALRRLARAVPAWWQAPETTAQDRQASVRGLVERVTVEVHEESAQVEVPGPGAGGVTRAQRLRRPGARSEQRSHAPDRVAHLAGRRQTGHRCAPSATQRKRPGCAPPKRTERCTGETVARLLRRRGVHGPRPRALDEARVLRPHESWRAAGAREVPRPMAPCHKWPRWGGVHSRTVTVASGRWARWADADALARLRQLRADHRTWPDPRSPQALPTPQRRARQSQRACRRGTRVRLAPQRRAEGPHQSRGLCHDSEHNEPSDT